MKCGNYRYCRFNAFDSLQQGNCKMLVEVMIPNCVDFLSEKQEEKKETDNKDLINHPGHYTSGKYEVMDVIEDWGFNSNFRLACALKYLARCEHKGKKIEDLKKAIWYLEREISKCEEGK
jgi:hypothetical protein